MTSHNKPAERVAGLSAGADDFIANPYNPAELVERVRAGERILSLETREVAIVAMAKLAESRHPGDGRTPGACAELFTRAGAAHCPELRSTAG